MKHTYTSKRSDGTKIKPVKGKAKGVAKKTVKTKIKTIASKRKK